MYMLYICFIGTMSKRVAVILAGCGVYDGTEIHEASAVLVHLSRAGAKVGEDQMSTYYCYVFLHFWIQSH